MRARPVSRSILIAVLSAVTVWTATACGSSSISTIAPTGNKCQVTVASSMQSVPYAGASGTVSVSTTRDCTWSAKSGASWISITSGSDGQGDGTVSLRIDANTDPAARHGSISINDASVELTQDAAPCQFSVSPMRTTASANGGSIRVSVSGGASCAWTATSNSGWISVASPGGGTGAGTATLNIAANSGDPRDGSVLVAGQDVSVHQDGAGTPPPPPPPDCTYTLTPPSQSVAASGGPASVSVATNLTTCAWDARSDSSWVTFTTGTGTGSGSVAFNVATNSGAARTATLTVGTATATVSQAAAACTFSIAPGSASFGANGGADSVTVKVTAGANCGWAATENASWISISSGKSGNGNGTVTYSVAANTGAARSATMTIAGKSFAVSQDAAPCSYSLTTTSQSIAAGGGTGSVGVIARNGCSWTATADAGWIGITSGTSGSGNGTVAFSVAANSGAARTGTITAAGQTFTITQAASCSYSINPGSQPVPAGGGTATVTVTASGGCSWTAAAVDSWITITSGASGSGNGTVTLTIAANGGAARSGTATIAGQTFTVMQDAAPACTYSIAPTPQGMPSTGGNGSVTLTTGASCAWTAASNVPWMSITSAASGTGSATVTFAVAANTDSSPRSGTATVAGQTLTVNQDAAACTFTIAPPTATVPPDGGGGTVNVTTGASCSWTAASNNPDWLAVMNGAAP